jgi:hypothetical protein
MAFNQTTFNQRPLKIILLNHQKDHSMKKLILFSVLFSAGLSAFAQTLPALTGLGLHLDAGIGFNANGAAAATWNDQSAALNHVTAGNSTTAEPVWTANAAGSGFPGVTFDGTTDFMTRTANSTFSNTAATMFVVRIGNTATNTAPANRTTISIAAANSYNNEFCLMSNWALHHTSSGNWVRKDHQCYSTLPNNLPVVTTTALNTGTANADVGYFINGVASTNAITTQSFPTAYTTVNRGITIGARLNGSAQEFFSGHILEVLAYNRVLTQTEIDDVHLYLKCKYQINYTACNVAVNCTPPQGGCNDLCYWRVTGNNIMNGNNIFGTLTNDDVEIQTNSTNRGVIKSGTAPFDGFFGWNTMTPTARLHVNCTGGNYESNVSDIRFQNLESGTGNILTIDGNGYVYNSGIGLGSGNYWDVNGNSITTQNFLGTTNGQDLRIRTWNVQRGVVASGVTASSFNSGFLGWNTAVPTARLHVDCINGNEGSLSDIRFENLESGDGTLLAIDAQGYVYNTGKTLTTAAGTFWDVNGNTVTPGQNILGTNNKEDVILRTDGIDKGIMTAGAAGGFDDGRLGWQTLSPTAHLHINCMNGNPPDGSMGSDVRFEELEGGEGEILVIDPQGYVYNSRLRLNPDGTIDGAGHKDNNRMQELENEIKELKAKLDVLQNCCTSSATTKTGDITMANNGNKLFQNTPNPFGKETVIEYYINTMQQSAYVMVYDLNGREISRFPVLKTGKGQVSVNAENMVAGMYLYSLVIDGREIDSKRMVLTK